MVEEEGSEDADAVSGDERSGGKACLGHLLHMYGSDSSDMEEVVNVQGGDAAAGNKEGVPDVEEVVIVQGGDAAGNEDGVPDCAGR